MREKEKYGKAENNTRSRSISHHLSNMVEAMLWDVLMM